MHRCSWPIGLAFAFVIVLPATLCAGTRAAAGRETGPSLHRRGGGPRGDTGEPGAPLPGLTPAQRDAFDEGLDEFEQVEAAADGLGPVFNGKSCVECHSQAATGGAGPDLTVSQVVRIGTLRNGRFDPLAELGGSLLQRRSIQEEIPDSPVLGEVVPPTATLVSPRITIPLFGAGLIEAIPVTQILSRADADDRNADGISGVPNRVFNPEAGEFQLGRFGWKAHVPTLHLFSGDAYLNELGITNPSFPSENLPQGQPIPPGSDLVPGLEDDGEDVEAFTAFMQFLAPLAPRSRSPQVVAGLRVFQRVGCANCHTPSMLTGNSPVAALRFKRVDLFSDLLLHDMGPGLADGIEMGSARGSEWRTAPLWGLSRRLFFLHHGRASTVEAAIAAHGGEATRSRGAVATLPPRDRDALMALLKSL